MNALKKIVIVFAVLIVLLYIVSLFLPGQMHVERSVVMNAPEENIFKQVNTLKNWDKWSPWLKMDSTLTVTYSGPESGVGASYSWTSESERTGSGTLTISESKPGELVVTDLDFGENGTGTGGFRFEPVEEGTRVTWYMESRLEGMIDKYMGLMMAGTMERIFDQGLNDMKTLAESLPAPAPAPDMVIEETRVAELHYLAIRDTVDTTSIGIKLFKDFNKVREVVRGQGLQAVGAPFAIYYISDEEDEEELVDSWMPSIKPWRFDACIGVDQPGQANGRVRPGVRPESAAVVAHYFGAYFGLHAAHTAINAYIADNEKEPSGPAWEEYITDPNQEPDTSKWQTDVYYPVKSE
jgi:hypothetical protein